jgi:hypothetical protein
VSSQLSRLALDAHITLPDTCNAARSCSSRTDLGDERRALQALTASCSAGPQEPSSQGRVSGLCHRSTNRRLGARFASAMGQTHRRIDPIDAAASLPKCFFPRASDALDVERSAWRSRCPRGFAPTAKRANDQTAWWQGRGCDRGRDIPHRTPEFRIRAPTRMPRWHV